MSVASVERRRRRNFVWKDAGSNTWTVGRLVGQSKARR